MRLLMSSAPGRASSVLAAFLVVGAASANAATFTYDFNSPQADFESKFNATGGQTVAAGQGLSGTQALGRTTGGGTYVYYETPVGQFTAAGQTASLSYYFFGSVNNATGTNDFLGFSTNITNGNPTSNSTTNVVAGVKAQLINNALNAGVYTNTSSRIETSNNSGSGLIATADSDTFVLPPSSGPAQWFYQTLSLTYNGGSSFDITSTLSNSDSAGNVGSLLDTYTVNRTNLTSLVNVPVYGGFQVHSSGGSPIRAGAADNFSVTAVPEPTAVGALAVAGCLLAARRRRREQA